MAENRKDSEQAKGLVKELIDQFGIDNVRQAVADHGIIDTEISDLFDSGLFDAEDDIPDDAYVDPEDDIEIVPNYEPYELYETILGEESIKKALDLDPIKFDPGTLVPLFMPVVLVKDKKGNIEGTVDVTAIGARKDGCRYVKISLGSKHIVKVKGKDISVGPEVRIILCKGDAAKAQADVFKNAFDLTKLREMGGTTKPGGKTARVQVKLGWKKGNNPIRDTRKPNTWRAPDAVEKV